MTQKEEKQQERITKGNVNLETTPPMNSARNGCNLSTWNTCALPETEQPYLHKSLLQFMSCLKGITSKPSIGIKFMEFLIPKIKQRLLK